MDFKKVWDNLAYRPVTYTAGALGNELKQIVAENGVGIFQNTLQLASALDQAKIEITPKQQLLLLAASSHIGDFLVNAKAGLNLVDIDNALHDAVVSTGLTYKTALKLITDIFYACGLDFAVEYGFVLEKDGAGQTLHAIMPRELAEAELERIRQLADSYRSADNEIKKKEAAKEAVLRICQLCRAGVADGFYLLAKCYLSGDFGARVDFAKAKEYLKIASDMGVLEASALLGDVYYGSDHTQKHDYTAAHYFYTRPGALALGLKQRKALHDIYLQGSANIITLIMSGIVFALSILFSVYFHEGLFGGAGRIAIAVMSNLLSGAVFGFAIFSYFRSRYNSIRKVIAVQYIIWAVYAFFLLIA
ncbi:MAG: hypothetical protein FWF85_04560 [Clostridiales bacterium]|nr:hypothetical protein [Clostridiales bacterium]